MNLSPVSRLKKTWGKVNTDKFEILEVRCFTAWMIVYVYYCCFVFVYLMFVIVAFVILASNGSV